MFILKGRYHAIWGRGGQAVFRPKTAPPLDNFSPKHNENNQKKVKLSRPFSWSFKEHFLKKRFKDLEMWFH